MTRVWADRVVIFNKPSAHPQRIPLYHFFHGFIGVTASNTPLTCPMYSRTPGPSYNFGLALVAHDLYVKVIEMAPFPCA